MRIIFIEQSLNASKHNPLFGTTTIDKFYTAAKMFDKSCLVGHNTTQQDFKNSSFDFMFDIGKKTVFQKDGEPLLIGSSMHYTYPMGPTNQAALAQHGQTYADIAKVFGVNAEDCKAFVGLKFDAQIYTKEHIPFLNNPKNSLGASLKDWMTYVDIMFDRETDPETHKKIVAQNAFNHNLISATFVPNGMPYSIIPVID